MAEGADETDLKVLGIAGSPRRHGNTETLLDRFLEGAQDAGADVQKIVAARVDVGGCIACDGCWDDGYCIVRDDWQEVYQGLVTADVIALASPLFFWNVTSQAKAIIDRCQSQWARKFVVKRPLPPTAAGHERRRGVFFCVGGTSRGYFEGVKETVKDFFLVNEADYWAERLYTSIDAKGEIKEHPTALDDADELGHRAVEEPWETTDT